MPWKIEVTDEFEAWYTALDNQSIEAVNFATDLLEEYGPALGRPHADTVRESRHANMKELRAQSGGRPLRLFFAFDPRRIAIVLVAGDKTADARFYNRMVPQADSLYEEHLAHLKGEHGSD